MKNVLRDETKIKKAFCVLMFLGFLTSIPCYAIDYDFDGVPRTGKYEGDVPDIGAFEWVPDGEVDYAPTVSITSPTSASTCNVTESAIDISGTASDDSGLLNITWDSDQGGSGTATNSSGDWSTWRVDDIVLQEGSNIITISATDDASKTGSDTITVVYSAPAVPDTEDPTVSISSPSSSDTAVISITGTASDNQALAGITWSNNKGGSGTATNVSGDWTSWSIGTITLQEGVNTITVTAQDEAGNSGSDAVNITYTIPEGTYTKSFGNRTGSDFTGTVQDTYININNEINSTSAALNTYSWPEDTVANAIVLKWDLSAIPASATIQSARLVMHMEESGGDSTYSLSAHKIINYNPVIGSCNGYTYDGTNSWTANTECYNNIPLAQADIATAVDINNVDATTGDKEWDITSIVQNWVSYPSTNYGVLINSDDTATDGSYRSFASSESTDSSGRPQLIVTYSISTVPVPTWSDTPLTINP